MNIHFIAIGGSAMHNLALALHKKGDKVSGSDDEIFEPSRSRLDKAGLLPSNLGWFPERIHTSLDAVILGMHAHADNPELARAHELGLKVYSYPEFLYEQSKNKKRVVIGGSHGKTTITSMILHALEYKSILCDYMVGAQLQGFDIMVKLSEESDIMILEGDEYLTSPIDRRPKFLLYQPDIALISGIAWDHINVFPTFEIYRDQFKKFAELIPESGKLIYNETDSDVTWVAGHASGNYHRTPYGLPEYRIEDHKTILLHDGKEYPLNLFGKHNLLNLCGAAKVCHELGMSFDDFYQSMESFQGASRRLEKIFECQNTIIYRDFAHAPSKLKASIEAAREQFPDRSLLACFELHTYSSLNTEFLQQYAHCMDPADFSVVYFNPHTLQLKRLPMLENSAILQAFSNENIRVEHEREKLQHLVLSQLKQNQTLLLMSSGNFDGMDIAQIKQAYLLLNNVKQDGTPEQN